MTTSMTICTHAQFSAIVEVNRLEDVGRFQACIRIQCIECGGVFEFVGLSMGVDLEGAAVSVDRTEARLAIVPQGEVLKEYQGPKGFSIARA